jgi:hypothetical protein
MPLTGNYGKILGFLVKWSSDFLPMKLMRVDQKGGAYGINTIFFSRV